MIESGLDYNEYRHIVMRGGPTAVGYKENDAGVRLSVEVDKLIVLLMDLLGQCIKINYIKIFQIKCMNVAHQYLGVMLYLYCRERGNA